MYDSESRWGNQHSLTKYKHVKSILDARHPDPCFDRIELIDNFLRIDTTKQFFVIIIQKPKAQNQKTFHYAYAT
jgi:hypothetical protein